MWNIMTEIIERRNIYPQCGGNSNRLVELTGAEDVLYQFYEPSPETTRQKYYYNTRLNRLYLKLNTTNQLTNEKKNIWKLVSER